MDPNVYSADIYSKIYGTVDYQASLSEALNLIIRMVPVEVLNNFVAMEASLVKGGVISLQTMFENVRTFLAKNGLYTLVNADALYNFVKLLSVKDRDFLDFVLSIGNELGQLISIIKPYFENMINTFGFLIDFAISFIPFLGNMYQFMTAIIGISLGGTMNELERVWNFLIGLVGLALEVVTWSASKYLEVVESNISFYTNLTNKGYNGLMDMIDSCESISASLRSKLDVYENVAKYLGRIDIVVRIAISTDKISTVVEATIEGMLRQVLKSL